MIAGRRRRRPKIYGYKRRSLNGYTLVEFIINIKCYNYQRYIL